MHTATPSPAAPGAHLRLVWPQWQGAGSDSVRELLPDLPLETARRGYAVGTAVLEAVLPAHAGPTEHVDVPLDDRGLAEDGGVEAREAVHAQLREALTLIAAHDPARITTLGGDCSVSIAPFSSLLRRYGEDLAILWIDSHPDIDTPQTAYAGHHAMAVSALTGHGDPELLRALPATTTPARVALAGMHDWTDPAHEATAADWGLTVIGPEELRTDSGAVLAWLRGTGASKVAVHLDVDTVDADEVQLGLGYDRGGLTRAQVRRLVADVEDAADVVALTIAEYVPRQVLCLQRLLDAFPLLGEGGAGRPA